MHGYSLKASPAIGPAMSHYLNVIKLDIDSSLFEIRFPILNGNGCMIFTLTNRPEIQVIGATFRLIIVREVHSKEEIERESVIHKDYDPLKSMRESEIIYPKEEREEIEETIEIASENREEMISEGMFGKPIASTEGNFIVEGMYGRPKYYIDGDIIRENNQFGRPAYRIDGNYIREGMYGRPKYYRHIRWRV